jgi:hypothetical protein
MSDKMELLAQFFGGYFHEDWSLDAKSPNEVVDAYRRDSNAERRLELSKAIQEYSERFANGGELSDRLFHDLGCYYDPTADGVSARDWLQSVSSQLLKRP